jgi:hypothetical protein
MSSDQRIVAITETQSTLGGERRNVRVSGADERVVAVVEEQGVEEAARHHNCRVVVVAEVYGDGGWTGGGWDHSMPQIARGYQTAE